MLGAGKSRKDVFMPKSHAPYPPEFRAGAIRLLRRLRRAVRAWLQAWIMVRRSWRGRSNEPPPPELQRLLDGLFQGGGIDLYVPIAL